jgi:hypothetical protein
MVVAMTHDQGLCDANSPAPEAPGRTCGRMPWPRLCAVKPSRARIASAVAMQPVASGRASLTVLLPPICQWLLHAVLARAREDLTALGHDQGRPPVAGDFYITAVVNLFTSRLSGRQQQRTRHTGSGLLVS